MKVETFKKLLVNMGKYKEKVFLVVLEIRKGYFFYRDETGEIQEEVIDLTDLSTNEVGDFVFDESDILTDYFDMLEDKVQYHHWFCGHYHKNLEIDDKHTILYEKIVPLKEYL